MTKKSGTRHLSLMIVGTLVVLASCTSPETRFQQEDYRRTLTASDIQPGTTSRCELTAALDENARPVMTQTIYVPVYSQIYERSERWTMNMTVTLSIRNTDLIHPITITTVCKYNTAGQFVERYVDEPVVLAPMASRHFIVEQHDTRGGVGASFIIKWLSHNHVNQPVVEAVMISRISAQGFSFVTQGRIIEQEVDESATPCIPEAGADQMSY